jgi:hypothetical protein
VQGSSGNRSLTLAFGLLCGSVLAGSLGGCHAVLGLDKYEKGDPEGGLGGQGGEGGDADCAARCDDKNDCTEDVCNQDGDCEHRTLSAGTECDGGVCNGVPGEDACQACVDDQPGRRKDTGCTDDAPQCRLGAQVQCVSCEKHSDCDDKNDCTVDACSADGSCTHTPEDAGEACDGGVCDGSGGPNACVICVDSEKGTKTDAGCDVEAPLCFEGACTTCIDTEDDDGQDLGCTEDAPVCTDSGCVECRNAADCTAPNQECSTVACVDGICQVTLHDDQCTSDDGCPGTCTTSGCEKTSLVLEEELLADPSFEFVDPEGDESYWLLAKSINGDPYAEADFSEYPNVFVTSPSARTGTHVARFDTSAALSYDIYQTFALLPGTSVLVFSGYYRAVGSAKATSDNYINGALYNYDDEEFHDYFMSTKSGEPYSLDPSPNEWTKFEWRITDFSDFPTHTDPEVNIFAYKKNQSGPFYEIDDISIKALVCE